MQHAQDGLWATAQLVDCEDLSGMQVRGKDTRICMQSCTVKCKGSESAAALCGVLVAHEASATLQECCFKSHDCSRQML